MRGLPLGLALGARIIADSERLEAAGAMAARVLSSGPDLPYLEGKARLALGLLAAHRADAAMAAEQYAAARRLFGTVRTSGAASMGRLYGIIAQGAGMTEAAAGHYEDALAFCAKAGYRPELAWTCCDYADLLLTRAGPADHERAMKLLEQGLALARDLGMRPLVERILSRRQILKA